MKRCSLLHQVLSLSVLAAFTVLVLKGAGADQPDFSGSYTLSEIKGSQKADKFTPLVLRVVQKEHNIEITRIEDGKATSNSFKLDGSKSAYTNVDAVKGVGSARLKGKGLIIETEIASRPYPNKPSVQIKEKQQWKLSPDLKTLTIRTDVDFPNSVLQGFQLIQPWTEIYTKDKP
jgi:hypothetical protein